MTLWTSNSYTFVVDTNKYSGNFCREMCAYMTGRIGTCGVGSEEQEMFLKELELDEDDLGPFREHTDIHSNDPSKATVSYDDDIIGMESDENGVKRPCKEVSNPGWASNGKGDFCRRQDRTSVMEFPCLAYMSVGIVLSGEPEQKHIDLLKERALKYGKMNGIEIEGFRLIVGHTVEFSKDL